MRKLAIDVWLVESVQPMYKGARSSIRICNWYSEKLVIAVGVHQSSVLGPLHHFHIVKLACVRGIHY